MAEALALARYERGLAEIAAMMLEFSAVEGDDDALREVRSLRARMARLDAKILELENPYATAH